MHASRFEHRPNYRWVVFAISYALMFYFAVPLQALPPLLPSVTAELPFSSSQAGLLMGSYGLPGLFMPLAAAALALRYDPTRLAAAGLGLMTLGLAIFAVSESFGALLAGRVLSGVGAKVVLSLAPVFVITFFSDHGLGTAIGFFNTAVPLGSILSLNAFGYLGERLGWRGSTASAAALGLVLAAAVLAWLRVPGHARQRQEGLRFRDRLRPGVWPLAYLNFLVAAVTLAFLTFAPGFFRSVGLGSARANLLASAIVVETAVFGPLVGALVDARGHKKPLLVGGGAVMAAALGLLAATPIPVYVGVGLLGLGAAVVPVVVFPLLKDLITPDEVPLAIALLIIASNLGSTVGPVAFGYVLDWAGFEAGFGVLGAASLLILPVALSIRPAVPGAGGTVAALAPKGLGK